MRSLLLLLLFATPIAAQNTNPTIEIIYPFDGGHGGIVIAKVDNFVYQPEQATNPVTEFANGQSDYGKGHVHGWLFKTDFFGRKKRLDLTTVPLPSSYLAFFGAGNAVWIPLSATSGYYILRPEVKRGKYKLFLQLQNDDHTASLQQTAPAFPGIDSVNFRR